MFYKLDVFVLSHCIYIFSYLLLQRNSALEAAKSVYLHCAHLQYYFYSQMKNENSHRNWKTWFIHLLVFPNL